jgi:hypothetical protein
LFVTILGHVVVFGGNTHTPSTYEILNIDSIGSWTLANFTLVNQAKESILIKDNPKNSAFQTVFVTNDILV